MFSFFSIYQLFKVTGCTAIPLFYYRMDAILPAEHILNSRYLRYSVYSSVYAVLPLVTAPILYFAADYDDPHALKQHLVQIYEIYYEDFMSDDVLATEINGSNPISTFIIVSMIIGCILGIVMVSISSYVIWQLTSKAGKNDSTRYKAQQRHLFLALVIMVTFNSSRFFNNNRFPFSVLSLPSLFLE